MHVCGVICDLIRRRRNNESVENATSRESERLAGGRRETPTRAEDTDAPGDVYNKPVFACPCSLLPPNQSLYVCT